MSGGDVGYTTGQEVDDTGRLGWEKITKREGNKIDRVFSNE